MPLKKIVLGVMFLSSPLISVAASSPAMAPSPVASASANASKSNLTVTISGIRNNNGMIRIAIFNSKTTYEDKNPMAPTATARARLPINNGEAVWQVSNIPYGVYGIKLFHDEDNSGKLKKTMVGRPTEGVGFSNNPKFGNRAPNFDEVKFTVDQPRSQINIRMINPK